MAFTLPSKRIGRFLLTAYAIALALGVSYFRVFDLYEFQTYDWRCQVRGPRPVSDKIVLIDIWDDTLKELGAWPFHRAYHADLITVLKSSGVKAIGMDLLFVEPREGDDEVRRAAEEAGNVFFVQAYFKPEKIGGQFRTSKILAPLLESYRAAAKAVGHVNASADRDGKRRRILPAIEFEGQTTYQLGLRLAMDALGADPDDVRRTDGELRLAEGINVPLDDGYVLVNYAGRWETTYQHYSYYDILAAYLEQMNGLEPRIDLSGLKDKICLVGLTSLGSHDTSPVPIQAVYPMVGMHANVLNSVLQRDFIRRIGRLPNLAVLILFAIFVILGSLRLRPVQALSFTLAALMLYMGLALGLFQIWGVWLDLFYPLLLLTILYAVCILGRALREIRKRELIESELKIASQIQKSFLPTALPRSETLEMAVYMKPAKAVGGDLYGFVSLEDGSLGVMLGDVSGKGTPAALFMARVVSEFKFSALGKTEPSDAVSRLNQSLSAEDGGGLFVTLAYAIFDKKSKTLRLCNGGHLPMVRVSRSGQSDLVEGGEGMPVGVMEGVPYTSVEMPLQEGDCLALYSDGVSEARNRKKEEYGIEALQRVLEKNKEFSAGEVLERAVADLNHFMGKADQHDDITLLIIKVGSRIGPKK